jgi:DNA-binding Lrp family transcriptional regulator
MSGTQTTNTLPTYLYATVVKHELNEVLRKLKAVEYVKWFGSTSGRYDIVASFKGNDAQKTYSAIKEIRSIGGVVSTTSMVPFEGHVNPNESVEPAMGQVFLRTDRPVQDVIQSLNRVSGVTEALAVSGQWDILATLRGRSYEDILAKAVQEISQISGIRTSETSFVYRPTLAA